MLGSIYFNILRTYDLIIWIAEISEQHWKRRWFDALFLIVFKDKIVILLLTALVFVCLQGE